MGNTKKKQASASPYRERTSSSGLPLAPSVRVCDSCKWLSGHEEYLTRGTCENPQVNAYKSNGVRAHMLFLPKEVREMVKEGACAYHGPKPTPRPGAFRLLLRFFFGGATL